MYSFDDNRKRPYHEIESDSSPSSGGEDSPTTGEKRKQDFSNAYEECCHQLKKIRIDRHYDQERREFSYFVSPAIEEDMHDEEESLPLVKTTAIQKAYLPLDKSRFQEVEKKDPSLDGYRLFFHPALSPEMRVLMERLLEEKKEQFFSRGMLLDVSPDEWESFSSPLVHPVVEDVTDAYEAMMDESDVSPLPLFPTSIHEPEY